MRIEFELPKYNIIVRGFCNYILRWLRHEIRQKTRISALQLRVDTLLEIELVDWINKPRELNAKQILEDILRSLRWRRFRNRYIIDFNPKVKLRNSNTPLVLVAKYLNYGCVNIRGCYFISRIFHKYQQNIFKYWTVYKIQSRR